MNRDDLFARVTRQHDKIARKMSPCASFLHHFLLRARPVGTLIEFEFTDFQEEQTYSDRWIRHALEELIAHEMIQVVRKFGAGVYRLIAFHPKEKNQSIGIIRPEIRQSTSEKQHSNSDSFVPLYREMRETTNKPTSHPVLKKEQERSIGSILGKIEIALQEAPELEAKPQVETQPEPQIEPELKPQVIEEIKAAGFRLNTALIRIVQSTTAQIVLDALEATQQYQRNLQQKNQALKREPEAVLVKAIQDQWSPAGSDRQGEVVALPDGFNEWFGLVRDVGLVGASSAQADLTGRLPGVLCVLTVSGRWEPFEQMRRLHSLDELRETVEMRKGAIEFMPSPRLVALRT